MNSIFAKHQARRTRVAGTMTFVLCLVAGPVFAQSTSGSIFGHGPAGSDVVAVSATGAQRHGTVDAKGRYSISHVQMGVYTVTLQKGGKDIDTRKNVGITVGRGAEVDFACPDDNCAAAQ